MKKKKINKSKLLRSLSIVDRFKGIVVINGDICIDNKYLDDYLVLSEFLDLIKRKKIKIDIEELGEDKDFEYIVRLLK